tara:strand:- start:68 stop:1303 length:1236 start_codon:yes stop_codon:yes gene_type:complete
MKGSKLSIPAKSWIAYDAGNSAFATTVLAAFFPIFFKEYWTQGIDNLTATAYLGYGLTISNLILLFTAPIIGAITDFSNATKTFFITLTILGIVSVLLLYTFEAGDWLYPLIFFGLANYCFAAGNVIYDKLLLLVADPADIGRVSGYGYAIGYLGGGFLFLINAIMTLQPEIFGLADSTEAVKWSFISVGVWWALFLIPIIKNVSVPVIEPQSNVLLNSIKKNIATLSKIKAEKNVFIFLIAFFLYIDGVHTVMVMASDFALNLNLESSSIILGLILVQFVAFPSTIAWSYIAEKKGEKNVLYVNILGYLALVSYSASLSNATEFYVMACMVGSIQGGIQAVSRSLFAKIIPIKSAGEFFGFYNMFGRAGAFLGPLLVAIFVSTFDSASYGLIPIAVLFVFGGLLLIKVKT